MTVETPRQTLCQTGMDFELRENRFTAAAAATSYEYAEDGTLTEILPRRHQNAHEDVDDRSQNSHDEPLNDAYFQQNDHATQQQRQLPRADGGKDAWLFLAACFMIEGLIWGML